MASRYDEWDDAYRSDWDDRGSRREQGLSSEDDWREREARRRYEYGERQRRTSGLLRSDYGGYGSSTAWRGERRYEDADEYGRRDFGGAQRQRSMHQANRGYGGPSPYERDEFDRGYDPNAYGAARYETRYEPRYDERPRRHRGDAGGHRGFWDRASDEVASWFGDEEAERRRRVDADHNIKSAFRGSHAGRGPKGYHRSDERIREDVNDRLTDHAYLDATEIDVRVAEGIVTLSGSVESRSAKRTAEDLAESVSGVRDVNNNIRVNKQWGSESSSLATSEPSAARASTTSTPSSGAASSRQSSSTS